MRLRENMIEKLDDNLEGIAIGVRFRPNFSIEDKFGEIIDTILYSKDAFFDPRVFPQTRGAVGKKILCNEVTNNNLLIDSSNFIIEIYFNEAKGGFKKTDLNLVIKNFKEQILFGVMKQFKICEVVRIGYIKRYLLKTEEYIKAISERTVSNPMGTIKDVDLRFSYSLPTEEALLRKKINDYDNVIFNIIKSANQKEAFLSLDYQRIYSPFLPSTSGIEFDEFIKRAEDFNSKKYLPWLNQSYGVIQ